MKRLLKPLACVLVAAQLLLAVPAMAAPVAMAQSASESMPCDECACCPDGVDSMKDCLASCMLAAVAAPSTQVSARRSAPPLRVDDMLAAPLTTLSEPPLKPPPIR